MAGRSWPRGSSRSAVSDRGVVAVLTAILIPLLLVLCAIAIDTGWWYLEINKVQKAADAAALGGVTSMPNDFTTASSKALTIASQNGYPNAGTTSVVPFTTSRESELGVTVSSTITNTFGNIFGNGSTVISRSAVADFQDAALLGSPCNYFGNQPLSNAGAALPANAVTPASPPGYATCQGSPGLWALIEGPNEPKVNGDRYATMTCSSGVDGCSGSTNTEYRKDNYYWTVRVGQEVVDANRDVTVQLYDPAYVDTDADCSGLSENGFTSGLTFPFAPSDYATRYDNAANAFCTGDNQASSSVMATSFVLRNQTDTQNPQLADPITNCTKQFRGYSSTPTPAMLSTGSSYNQGLAKIFHQWVNLCSFRPTKAGDYYLQVRSNVTLGGSASQGETNTNSNSPATYTYPGTWSVTSPNVVSQVEPTVTNTDGINAFAIRAFVGTPAENTGTPDPLNAKVAVSGWERMPIWINADNAGGSYFNLIQVLPNAAGKSFTFSGFDFGDCGSCSGTSLVQVLMPTGSTGSLTTCTGTGPVSGSIPTVSGDPVCSFRISSATHQGKLQEIAVTIPSNYTCASGSGGVVALGDCWFRMKIDYSNQPNDVTTWDAAINGDNVRLVQ
ncbi:MAG: TadE/TadG family type IV pilus assembly protein [Actinomycetes bacterium]